MYKYIVQRTWSTRLYKDLLYFASHSLVDGEKYTKNKMTKRLHHLSIRLNSPPNNIFKLEYMREQALMLNVRSSSQLLFSDNSAKC